MTGTNNETAKAALAASHDAGPGSVSDGYTVPEVQPEIRKLVLDRDFDICVVGAGLAGLTVALEAARLGARVVVLEAGRIGDQASGHQAGSVMAGFGVPVETLIDRVGNRAARDLWGLSRQGMAFVHATATASGLPALQPIMGALQVSHVDRGDELIRHLQLHGENFGEDFGDEVEGWQVERVRDTLRSKHYFHALHYPQAFHVDGQAYLKHLAALARRAGVRIFEDTPVVGIDYAGIRKRVMTPLARVRADHLVLAGNVHLGKPFPRLGATLTPVWRYGAVTQPLGEKLAEVVRFAGTVMDATGIDHYRLVENDRLLWVSPETTWAVDPQRFASTIRRRIRTIFPDLGPVAIDRMFCGVNGETVHGMPQIGELRQGLWVASGFGRQGFATSAMAGQLIARGILRGDDQWRRFDPFELVWAGGRAGRAAAHIATHFTRRSVAVKGALSRTREGARERARVKNARVQARIAAASGQARRDDTGAEQP